MTEYREFESTGSAEEWDGKLEKFDDFNFQQTYSFGEFGNAAGSQVFRAMLVDGARTLVMAQGVIRRTLFGARILVIRGGPVYQASKNEDTNLKHLRTFLQKLVQDTGERYRCFYINMTMTGERSVPQEIAIREAGMAKPYFERAPYLTYMLPIHADLEVNMKAFDSKWRNQLRRAESANPVVRWGNDDALLASYLALHNAMCRIKSLENYALDRESLVNMRRHFGEKLQFLVMSNGDRDVCGCAVIITGNKAYYYYAAANEEGRTGYFSNAMVWRLIGKLRDLNVTELDMAGADPVRNWGGYHFKKGTGGRPYAYSGEWDLGAPRFIKLLMNAALYWRTRQLYR
jgi:hypothetical protein